MTEASAPGKLVLIGEYAVLEGAPALVAAVSRRARVNVGAPREEWTVHAPQLGIVDGRLDDPRLDLVRAVIGQADPAELSIDTSDFFDANRKLGLGSSAAVSVALEAALRPGGNRDEWFERARAAHSAAQGGGSGIDVAASAYGGILRYVRADTPTHATLPDELAVLPVWTGVSASTPGLVAAVTSSGASLDDLDRISRDAIATTDAGSFLALVRSFLGGLRDLERAAGVAIVTGPHERIAKVVEEFGGAYKPSGAGGGDVGLAFCESDAEDALRRQLTGAGVTILTLELGAPGVEVS